MNTRSVTGQCAQVRIHNLRVKGFNIITTILPEIEFRSVIRRNSIGAPEWITPNFLTNSSNLEN